MLCKHFAGMIWVHFSPQKERFTANQCKVLLNDHLYLMMKCFFTYGSGHFQDKKFPIQRAWGLTEGYNEVENDINHMLWPSQSVNLNPVESKSNKIPHSITEPLDLITVRVKHSGLFSSCYISRVLITYWEYGEEWLICPYLFFTTSSFSHTELSRVYLSW